MGWVCHGATGAATASCGGLRSSKFADIRRWGNAATRRRANPELAMIPQPDLHGVPGGIEQHIGHVLAAATEPRFMRLTADWYVRGGIYTHVVAEHRAPGWTPRFDQPVNLPPAMWGGFTDH